MPEEAIAEVSENETSTVENESEAPEGGLVSLADSIKDALREQSTSEEEGEEKEEGEEGEEAPEEEEVSDESEEEESEEEEDEEEGEKEEDELEIEDLSPPKIWDKEKKDKWEAIPEEYKALLKDDIKARNKDYTKKMSLLSAERKEYKPLHDLISPHMDQLAKLGQTPAAYFQTLLQVDSQLSVDPAGTITRFIEKFQLTAEDLGFTDGDEFEDEDIRRQRQEQRKLKAENSQLKADKQLRDTRQVHEQTQDYEQLVQDFEEATNEEGEPLYPHFQADGVLNDMVDLMDIAQMRGKVKPTLEEAYNRSQTVKSLNRKTTRKKDESVEKRRKVATARKKTGVIAKSPANVETKGLSGREAIRAALHEQGVTFSH